MTLLESLGAAGVLVGGAVLLGVWRRHARAVTSSMPSASRSLELARGEWPVLDGRAVIIETGSAALLDALQVKLGMPQEVFDASVRPMIEAYAAFVQCLATKTDRDHKAVPMLRQALRSVHGALDRRRDRILPHGVAPEDIGALAHRWSYAVMVVALVEVARTRLSQVAVTFRSAERSELRRWIPAAGSLRAHDALAYRYEQVAEEPDESGFLGFTLLHVCVPPAVLAWLAEDARVLGCLDAVLGARSTPDASLLLSLVVGSNMLTLDPSTRPVASAQLGDEAPAACPLTPLFTSVEVEAPPAARHGTSLPLDADTAAFLRWLGDALGRGAIAVNVPDAPIHGVREGLLLVTPQIVAEYAKVQSADPARAATFCDTAARRRTIQRGLGAVAGATPNVAFELHEHGAVVSRVSGIVLIDPERFGIDRPAVNAGLVDAALDLL